MTNIWALMFRNIKTSLLEFERPNSTKKIAYELRIVLTISLVNV